jgi:radical SAM superfamily enzyme YgiQ (UPF0313 family)
VTRIGLVQIGENFGGQYYLPYSVGLLQSYAQQNLKNIEELEFLLPIYKRIPIDEAVDYFRDASVVFFSVYLWNLKYSLEIARQVRLASPQCIIVFGGPQVPYDSEALELMIRKHPYIDIGCYSDGEVPFAGIIENLPKQTWLNVLSIGFIDCGGSFVQTDCSDRISNLDEIPSPYLTGIFEPLMKKYPEERWSALWETNRGCPFTCAFCAWGANSKKKIYKYGMDRLNKEIDWFSRNKIEFIFCCDANFGIFEERDLGIVDKIVENKEKYKYPIAFSVQSTKNASRTIFKLQKRLNDAKLQKGVNIALQSLNGKTLESINRGNISISDYYNLQKMFTDEGIATFSDIIMGLPDETYESFTNGVSSLIEGGQHNRIQFINLAILENTEMAKAEYQEKHGLVLQGCRMASHHTTVAVDKIVEIEQLVVGTNTLSKKDWVKTRVFAWMVSLLYFDKLMQIPFIILNKVCSVSYRELIELFMISDDRYPIISEINDLFTKKALSIQSGDCEYMPSIEWLNIWWRADEFAFIKLYRESAILRFYEEAERVIGQYIDKSGLSFPIKLLHEAVHLNVQLVKSPLYSCNQEIFLGYNIIDVYKATLVGEELPIIEGNYCHLIIRDNQLYRTWDEWCREVVWYGTKKGEYLHEVS